MCIMCIYNIHPFIKEKKQKENLITKENSKGESCCYYQFRRRHDFPLINGPPKTMFGSIYPPHNYPLIFKKDSGGRKKKKKKKKENIVYCINSDGGSISPLTKDPPLGNKSKYTINLAVLLTKKNIDLSTTSIQRASDMQSA